MDETKYLAIVSLTIHKKINKTSYTVQMYICYTVQSNSIYIYLGMLQRHFLVKCSAGFVIYN